MRSLRSSLVLLLALAAVHAHATQTVVQSGELIYDNQLNRDFPSTSTTWTVTAGNLLVCTEAKFEPQNDDYLASNLAYNTGTATLGTVALAKAESNPFDGGASTIAVGIWHVPITGSGTLRVRIASGNNAYTTTSCMELAATSGWSATAASRIVGTPNSGETQTNSTTAVTSNDTVSTAGAIFVGVTGFDGSGTLTITPDGAFTETGEEENASAHMTGSHIRRIVTAGTTDAAEWTVSSGNNGWVAAVAAFVEVTPEDTGGGGNAPRAMHHYRQRTVQ